MLEMQYVVKHGDEPQKEISAPNIVEAENQVKRALIEKGASILNVTFIGDTGSIIESTNGTFQIKQVL